MKIECVYNNKFRCFLASLVLFSAFISTACLPKSAVKKISAFSDGVNTVMSNTVSAYQTIETVYDRRNKERFAKNYNPVSTDINRIKFGRFIPEEDWKARKLVIDGLRQYADNLKAVVSDDQLEEFDAKTKALGHQLVSLQATTVKTNILKSSVFKDSEIRIFTTAMRTIGRWFIDYKRKKVVRETVVQMQFAVKRATDLFAKEIGEDPLIEDTNQIDARQVPTLRKKLWRDYSDLIRLQNDFLRNSQNRLSAIEEREEKLKLLQMVFEREQADKTLASVAKALKSIPEAHDAIEKAFDEKDTTLEAKIARIFEEAEQVKSFYESLKKE